MTVPQLDIAAEIKRQVAAWADVTVELRGRDFVEFKVGRRELGHLHGSRLADLPFPVRIREALVRDGKASLHHSHPETGWVSCWLQSAADISAVVELFRMNYDRPWLHSPGAVAR
jgi:hypothetical protein